jgi:SPP1 gp7 family putative phage head morphogenesis protein
MREAEYVLNALPFDEMLKYFQGKIPISAEMYYAMIKEARERAFTVSNIESLKALEDLQRSLGMAMEKGWTLSTWKASMADLLDAWDIEGWHANTIYWTNMATAYQIGRYDQMTDPDIEEMFPYWQYIAVEDNVTRPNHAYMDGKVFRRNDPIWDEWYPLNGFN